MDTRSEPEPPVELYSNAVRVTAGAFDFMLEFGLQDPVVDSQRPPATRQLARVRVSPLHAAVLARILSDTVERYRRQVGLEVPDLLLRQLGLEP